MGQWVMGHGSNGSPFLDGSRGSSVTAGDPLTHDDEITAQYLAIFLFLVYIKKMPTHSVSPIIIAGGLILMDIFFALKTERVVQYHRATPPPCPMRRGDTMGHGSWVMWVMGQLCDGSHGSWVTNDDPFPSLVTGILTG